jgi:hypothetical protein
MPPKGYQSFSPDQAIFSVLVVQLGHSARFVRTRTGYSTKIAGCETKIGPVLGQNVNEAGFCNSRYPIGV